MPYDMTIRQSGNTVWEQLGYDGDSAGGDALFTVTGQLRERGVGEPEIDALHAHYLAANRTTSGDVDHQPGARFVGSAGIFGVEIARS